VLPPDAGGDGERERFRREARIAARLTHPNIVPLHSVGEVDGVLYFVMGYVRGEALGLRMRRGLSVASARRILIELASALDHAHRQGVVHRDVKPDNVLVDDDSGRAMLTDFGIARRDTPSTLTSTGAVIGTPHYMSPEQASGATTLDGRSDIYSLGVLAYAMLAGRLPFDGPTVGAVLVQHVSREPAPLRSVAPAVPEALAAVVARCLAKDPRDRWPNARALQEALVASETGDGLAEPLREVEGDGRPDEDGVWDRLPARLRVQRWLRLLAPAVGVAGLFLVLAFVSPRFHLFADWPTLQAVYTWPPLRGDVRDIPPVGPPLSFLAWTFVLFAAFVAGQINERWLARFGLPEHDRRGILHGPLARRTFWTRDAIAAVLRPRSADEAAPARTPAEMAGRIVAAAEAFTGRDAEIVREAAEAAQHLLASIQEADAEVERVSRDFDPLEPERVRTRLAGLGAESPDEPEERRRMRVLLEQQSGLLQSLEARVVAAVDRRQRRVDLMKSLWLEVANLKAAATVAVDDHTSARVQAICARIAAAQNPATEAIRDGPTLAR
jgi:hypothetical protein